MRSLLFAPGNDERKLTKALSAGADAVIADLEDAVPPDEKETARAVIRTVFTGAETAAARIVRVNGADTAFFAEDLALIGELDLDAVVVPKASPASMLLLGGDAPPVLAIVETAQGLRCAYEIASDPRVAALILGAADLGRELGFTAREDGLEILYARSELVVDSAAAKIRPPIDGVHLDYRDDDGLRSEALLARSLGFGGKLCIHPAQVPHVNEAFTPTEAEFDWARRVIDAFEAATREGRGAVGLDGSMIDLPVVDRARRILSEKERRPDER